VLSNSFAAAVKRGVAVRMIFNQDHAQTIPEPPPPEIDWAFVDQLKSLGVAIKPVPGIPDLMHHKYVVRDAALPQAALLTGSTNWTNDSWTREENVIVTAASSELAGYYRQNFEELWQRPDVAASGRISTGWLTLADSTRLRPYFLSGARAEAGCMRYRARSRRLKRGSVSALRVITSGPILGTLAEVCERGNIDVSGGLRRDADGRGPAAMGGQATASWKINAFHSVVAAARFGSKRSTPYAKGSVHDFMHAKILVADDYVYVGSFNLSHSGEMNAENVLQIESAAVADTCAAYIDRIAARYGGPPLKGA